MASKDKKRQDKGPDKEHSGPTKLTPEDKPLKVNKWDGSAVKHALDDTVKKIMKEEYGCVESHRLMDTRLMLCTIACSFSGFALVYDQLHPFPASLVVLTVCALSYFFFMAVVTIFGIYKEGSTIMLALEKDEAGVSADNVWTLSSSLPRFHHMYTLTAAYYNGQTKKVTKAEFKKSVAEWFNEEGTLLVDRFFMDIKNMRNEITIKKDE